MVTKEWVAIHRKHHAKCEKEGDPHSPILFGIWKVLFRGAELYREESNNKETMAKFGHGTPDDWLERNVYSKHSLWGVLTMLAIDIALFGAIGVTVWAVQMAWIPFWPPASSTASATTGATATTTARTPAPTCSPGAS